MFSGAPKAQALVKEFEQLLSSIDKNIASIESSVETKAEVVTETNKMISTASLTLAKLHQDNQNDVGLVREKLAQLERRKNKMVGITQGLQKKLLTDFDKKYEKRDNIINEKISDQGVDVGLITDYNEKLLQNAVSNLHEINSNLKETAINLKGQGEKLQSTNSLLEKGNMNAEKGRGKLDKISCSKKCRKIWMIIINILLFLITIMILTMKILSYLK